MLTQWGPVTHICVSKLIIIGSDNGLSPGRRQVIIWTNAGIMLELLIEIHTSLFKKIHLTVSSGKWWSFCFGLNVLTVTDPKCVGLTRSISHEICSQFVTLCFYFGHIISPLAHVIRLPLFAKLLHWPLHNQFNWHWPTDKSGCVIVSFAKDGFKILMQHSAFLRVCFPQ